MKALKEELREYFKQKKEVITVYLFGSYSQNRQNRLSDLDMGILVDEKKYKELDNKEIYGYKSTKIVEISKIAKCPVDIVILNYATPLLNFEAIKYGRVIFSKDEDKRINFEIKQLKRYSDTKYLRKIQEHYLYERIDKNLMGEVS